MLSDMNDCLYLLEEIRRVNAVLDGKARGPRMGDGHVGTESDALIAERNRLLDRLREVGEEYVDFYDHAPDMFVSVDASTACVRKCNQTLLENLGYSREEVIGHPIFDLYHPDCMDNVKIAFQTFQTTGEVHDEERALRRKDGSKIEVSLNVSSIRDPQGKVVSSRSIWRDITERKRAQAALMESGERNRSLAEVTTDFTVTSRVDEDGSVVIEHVTEGFEKTTGYTLEELRASGGWPAIIFPEDMPLAQKSTERLLAGHSDRQEIRIRTKQGEARWLDRVARPITDPLRRRITKIYTGCQDITERKCEEELRTRLLGDLERANRGLEVFSAAASHDLRAPLRTINGFVYYLLKDHAPHLPPEAQEYLNLIQKSAKRMDQLIQDLLSFSHLTHQPLQKQPVDLTALVRATLEELRAEQEGRRVEITIGDLPVCQGDPTLLKQVFINLLGNALKYSRLREVARIEVGFQSETPEREPVFFVKDNGIGFDPKWGHEIFKAFQRLHTASEYEGTGVGLAIVQRAIEQHRGRVWAEATVDTGATFFFTLGNRVPTQADATDKSGTR